MRMLLFVAVACFAMAGCSTTSTKLSGFFGTSNPCDQAELGYAAFVTIAATTDKVPASAKQAAKAGLAAFRQQCSDGSVDKITLAKAVRAYVAGLEAWKS